MSGGTFWRTKGLLSLALLITLFSFWTNLSAIEEKGFHLSENTTLHLGLFLAPEYRTNVYNISERSKFVDNLNPARSYGYKETDDLLLRILPSWWLDHRDDFKTLAAWFNLNYYLYTGMSDEKTFDSFNKADAVYFRNDLLGEFNKNGRVTARIVNTVRHLSSPDTRQLEPGRHLDPFEDLSFSAREERVDLPAYPCIPESGGAARIDEDLLAELFFRNNDDSLSLKVSSALLLNYYDHFLNRPLSFLSSRNHIVGSSRFLPRLSAFFDASFTYQGYLWDSSDAVSRSMPVSLLFGIVSPLTADITLRLAGGYINSLGDEYHHDGIAGAEFVYSRENIFLQLAYRRILMPQSIYQYSVEDRVSLNYSQKFFDRLLLRLAVSYAHFQYGKNMKYPSLTNVDTVTDTYTGAVTTTTFTQKSVDREDHLISVSPTVSYYFLPWLGLSLQYVFETKQTPFFTAARIAITGSPTPTDLTYTYYYDYMFHRVLLALILDY